MTDRNPIPYCLPHPAPDGAAVRARALEDAACIAQVILDNVLSRPQPLSGFDAGLCLGVTRARDYIRALIPTPAAPASVQSRGPHNACDGGTCDQPDNCAKEGECHYTKSPFQQGPPALAPDTGTIDEYVIARRIVVRLGHSPDANQDKIDWIAEEIAAARIPAPDEAAIRAELVAALRLAQPVLRDWYGVALELYCGSGTDGKSNRADVSKKDNQCLVVFEDALGSIELALAKATP